MPLCVKGLFWARWVGFYGEQSVRDLGTGCSKRCLRHRDGMGGAGISRTRSSCHDDRMGHDFGGRDSHPHHPVAHRRLAWRHARLTGPCPPPAHSARTDHPHNAQSGRYHQQRRPRQGGRLHALTPTQALIAAHHHRFVHPVTSTRPGHVGFHPTPTLRP